MSSVRNLLYRFYLTKRTRLVLAGSVVAVALIVGGLALYQPVNHSWVVPPTLPVSQSVAPTDQSSSAASACAKDLQPSLVSPGPVTSYAAVPTGSGQAVFFAIAKQQLFSPAGPDGVLDAQLAVPVVCVTGQHTKAYVPHEAVNMSLVTPVQVVVTRLNSNTFALGGVVGSGVSRIEVSVQRGTAVTSVKTQLNGSYFALVIKSGGVVSVRGFDARGRVSGVTGGQLTGSSLDTIWS